LSRPARVEGEGRSRTELPVVLLANRLDQK
jgi:hypothetical protein